jgi:hypothetical protein
MTPTLQPLTPLWTFDEVVDALGALKGVEQLTGMTAATICNHRRTRQSFPAKYYFCIKAGLEDRGYYAPISMFGFVREPRPSKSRQQAA